MSGRTCLVTGATSGIGQETAVQLAGRGAAMIIVARDARRGATAAAEIRRRVPSAQVEIVTADLSDMAQVRGAAGEILDRCDRLDVLVSNAGVIMTRRQLSADGLEMTFATNHLGPFLLVSLLRGRLEDSAPARIVVVSSAAHRQVREIPWDDLPGGSQVRPEQAYPLSKLANILFTRELARRLADSGVTANCLHPGFVRTALGRDVTGLPGVALRLGLRFVPGPDAGARTPVYLASSPEVTGVTGGYFARSRLAEPSALARDDEAAARLWALSEELVSPES
ncbi:MAG TPA: SDR family oxidoreductase [Streptosporangiaceae bacterium]|jgi:NAD(P)-dependent dehydrogenase (short-subunit alcohol dehydrogenase family)|nr:SDR family oxidoreductase [Streptosporangiaceae bacterium]